MLDFRRYKNEETGEEWIETSLSGKPLLTIPQLNKGTAFSVEERHAFGLMGKLPQHVENLEDQVTRVYGQLHAYEDKLTQNIFLNSLHDTNQTLFYKLVGKHLGEMLPIIYTPIVGTAVKEFSREFRHARGIYLSYPERQWMEEILKNRSNPEIDLIVVTDGEGVLGIGDQGIGGMDIPIAKLMVYTLCGGIDPTRTLPILLDVGTNNRELLDNPLYLGWRHERLEGKEYEDFVQQFVSTIQKLFPKVFLHWEDFGRDNARKHLNRYRNTLCTFNDDMQGTGVVTLAAILAAVKSQDEKLSEQQIVIFGAGTAGTGIADQICDAMVREGISLEEARKRFWLLDKPGLLMQTTPGLTSFQEPYAHESKDIASWSQNTTLDLMTVIQNVKPHILIGCSAVTGAFKKEIIEEMAKHVKRPIILPLSNPTERCEATPENLLEWTQGKVLLAAGSPFDPVTYGGRTFSIAQCNNALVFPGLGLGLMVVKATRLTDDALWAACETLSLCAPILKDSNAPVLPTLDDAREIAGKIALAVAEQVIKEGNATEIPKNLAKAISDARWEPHYLPYVLKK